MDLKGKIVIWNALNTQKETVKPVMRGKGDYMVALKGNHHLFYKEVQEYFSEETLEILKKQQDMIKKRWKKDMVA